MVMVEGIQVEEGMEGCRGMRSVGLLRFNTTSKAGFERVPHLQAHPEQPIYPTTNKETKYYNYYQKHLIAN